MAVTASQPEAVGIYCEPMYKLDLVKFDPIAYLLIAAVLVLEVYSTFVQSPGELDRELVEAALEACRR